MKSANKKNKKNITPASIIGNIFLYASAILSLWPLYWMVTGSFKLQSVVVQLPPEWFPSNPVLDNYKELFATSPVWNWMWSSIVTASLTAFFVCLVSSLAGYSFAKKNFVGKKILFVIVIATLSIPKQVLIVPLYRILRSIGLFNTYAGVIVPSIGWPFGVFLMKQFSETVPTEMIEAARIDGCGELRIFSQIVIPMIKAGIGALAVFTFVTQWNDYMWHLVIINKRLMMTLPLGIATLQEEFTAKFGLLMAGATMSAIPMTLIFIFFQRYFTEGITIGAVKG